MGKIIDFLMTNSWEEYNRVQLYKEIGQAAKNMSKEQIIELQKLLNKINSKVKE